MTDERRDVALCTRVGLLGTLCLILTACGSGIVDPGSGPFASRIQAGADFTCALDRDGIVTCWGRNARGQLGIGSDVAQIAPVRIEIDKRFISLSTKASGVHACAVTERGAAYCWGENEFGQLGDGSTVDRMIPTPVTGELIFRTVTAGWRFSCALTTDDDAYCWGRGEWGQLGDGRAVNSTSPIAVLGGHKFAQIEVGSNNLVCGLTRDGDVLCWGLDFFGSLGSTPAETCTRADGLVLACAKLPQPITSDLSFQSITVGNSFACAIDVSGGGWCWGANGSGQLGTVSPTLCPNFNNTAEQPCNLVPDPIDGGLVYATLTAGVSHSCGVTASGDGYCWGNNEFGKRGDGSLGNTVFEPVLVSGGLTFASISAGGNHTCAETVDGGLWCWGANDVGQLGTGNNNLALSPASVAR